MTALDDLPLVQSFLGLDLKTGALIVAAICIVHPMAYGCSFFMSMSYLLVTIWILVALFFATSVGLFFGVAKDDALLCYIWIWYALIFVAVMLMMMILLALVFTSRRQRNRVCVTIIGMLWYILTIYFILVVNSYRRKLDENGKSSNEEPSLEQYLSGTNTDVFNNITNMDVLTNITNMENNMDILINSTNIDSNVDIYANITVLD